MTIKIPEKDMFYSNSSKKGYNHGNNRGFYMRGSSYNTRKETENRRSQKNPLDRDCNKSHCNICESVIGPLIAQKQEMKLKQMIFKSVTWLSFLRRP